MANMINLADEQLIALFTDGSDVAFEALYKRYQGQVFSYVLKLSQDMTLAEDFSQDVWLKVVVSLREGKYSHDNKLVNWIMSIAHNVVYDYFRRDHASIREQVENIEQLNCAVDEVAEHEEVMAREAILTAVEHEVSLLSSEQKSVVELRYFKDLSFKEIADLEGISVNTALGRMHYAVLNLRKQLAG